MKKTALTLTTALLLTHTPLYAADTFEPEWIGIYGMYYNISGDKPEPIPYLDDGYGGGIEMGFRIKPRWAARIEATYLDIDGDGSPFSRNGYGPMIGADGIYFLEDEWAYVFAGARMLDVEDEYFMVDVGIGKHWYINDKFRVITELAGYQALNESVRDYSVKLGLAYTFGASSPSPISQPEPSTPAPMDSDKDGVFDDADNCPGTPMGTKVDVNGCPMPVAVVEKDTDRDGVIDKLDQCPNTPTEDKVDDVGCSVFGKEVYTQTIRVLFANNSDVITNPNESNITDFVGFMKRYVNVNAVIEGHSSAPGNADYNMDLSQRRADAFKTLLTDTYGIAPSRLTAQGFGETQLLDTSNTAEAHRVNRRIAVTVSETVRVKVKK